jgi:2-polyprenyl-6-methoxyphenol hydroxylase-like FAD-dependent oxidoreductase
MATTSHDVDALIVGAGPVGLVLALELGARGLRCRLIDQLPEPVRYSKAQAIHARTLELLEPLGVSSELVARGIQVHGMSVYTPDLRRLVNATFEPVPSRFPYILSLAQHETEAVLTARLGASGCALDRAVRLVGFTQGEGGVVATLARADGATETVSAAWLLGCDGAHSTVRKALELPFEGSTYELRIIQADVRIDWGLAHAHDELVLFLAPTGMLGIFPLPGERRYRMLTFLDPEVPLEPVLESFQHLMAERGPEGARVSEPAWMVDFRIHRRMVPRYREGRVFLLGDAAHIHSPAGGQGMNNGIQDAMNLGWKLSLVHRGEAPAALLDSYHAERHPVAESMLRGTDTATKMFSRVMGLRNPVALELRAQLFKAVGSTDLLSRGGRLASMLEVAYPNSPWVAQDRALPVTLPSQRDAEPPGLRDWVDFGEGPAPGSRAPDLALTEDPEGARLFDLLRHRGHTVLLFDGAVRSEAGYRNLADITQAVTACWGSWVQSRVVVALAERPAALDPAVPVLLDPEGEVHRAFGARGECLYVLRPDGYVGYRSQPARLGLLEVWLTRVFGEGAAGPREASTA